MNNVRVFNMCCDMAVQLGRFYRNECGSTPVEGFNAAVNSAFAVEMRALREYEMTPEELEATED